MKTIRAFEPRLLCPKCQGDIVVRFGCQQCGSSRQNRDQLLHHYRCAHVDTVEAFGTPPVCPKCRRHLTPGADFEQYPGPYICDDCGWQDMEREFVARCLKCEFLFPLIQAEELIEWTLSPRRGDVTTPAASHVA